MPNGEQKRRHQNDGACAKCRELFGLYPGFHRGLESWFFSLQERHKDAHISCAGRGEKEQNAFYKAGTSRAKWGESAHNYNAAIDVFRLTNLQGLSYDAEWFKLVIREEVEAFNKRTDTDFKLNWYGSPGTKFFELPHIEVLGWRKLNVSRVT